MSSLEMPEVYAEARRIDVADIPIIDFGPFLAGTAADRARVAAEIGRACETVGFLYIKNHGVPQALIDATFDAAARFHAQPLEAKMAVKLDDTMQGYLPYRSSTARANGLVAVRKPNENLITRLSQLVTARYKSGTVVCLQRDSRGPQLSAVPEGAQRS